MNPPPVGWIRPQAAPKFLFFFIKSTSLDSKEWILRKKYLCTYLYNQGRT
jgi:hypothetical protein